MNDVTLDPHLWLTLDVAAPHSGVLESILVPAGERFARGAVLARVIPL